MQDFQSNGTGNSRYLKSVSDFLTQYPTYADFAAALVDGTLPVDFNGVNAAGITQRGTPYNKANVLTDETAAMFGLGSSATLNQVLSLLGSSYGSSPNYFGVCFSVTNPFTVTVSDKFILKDGVRVTVFFDQMSVVGVGAPMLNVNGTGAYPIRMRKVSTKDWHGNDFIEIHADWADDQIVDFVFYDNCWMKTAPSEALCMIQSSYTGNGNYGKGESGLGPDFYLGCFPVFGWIYGGKAAGIGLILSGSVRYYLDNGSLKFFGISENPSRAGYYRVGGGESATYQMNESGATYFVTVFGTPSTMYLTSR